MMSGVHAAAKHDDGSGERGRFSPTEYSAKLRLAMPEAGADGWDGEADADGARAFAGLAEDIRNYVAAPLGMTDEQRDSYGERLNKAVLGFPKERAELLALIADRLIRKRVHRLPNYRHPYQTLAEALFAEVIGLNVLELILADKEELEEVRSGAARVSGHRFASIRDVERIQQNLVLYNNDRINPRKRWAEVTLSDGSRVTMTGFGFTAEPTLTIRFYTVKRYELAALSGPAYRTMDEAVHRMLLAILHARLNIVVIGPTNAGKTHLIKSLLGELPDEERIVTIEGRFEMRLSQTFPNKNVIEYETDEEDALHRPVQAFKLALRQSPQRIVHAEIRDEDANIYVRACTRGHTGSMTTVHANALEDVPEAITDMCMLDGRAMNPERLAKRIALYVTQVGIEMQQANGYRRIVRIGRFDWVDGAVAVRDWVRYSPERDEWIVDPEAPC
jgi:pilus assembly protein CpaF